MLIGHGRVETVFRRAVNILMDGGLCLSLVDSELDEAPNRIKLPQGYLQLLPVNPGDPIWVAQNSLMHRD
ncbi:MAG: hypothetical protein Q8N36_05375, partial [bacterium]|nr:hypothetical protein [bacterium]